MIAEAIVLGSGTSNGVPTLGVDYSPEFLANPKNHRTRPSLLLKGPTGNVLIDCAPEMRLQLVREDIKEVHGVIITHTHADHIMGMDDLRSYCQRMKCAMPVYTLPRYQDDIRRVFSYAFQEFPPGIEVPRFELHDAPETLEIGGLSLKLRIVMHGPVLPVLAVIVGRFAYVTDVKTISDDVFAELRGLDTLILDAVRYKPHPNHLHFDAAVEMALELGARQTYFTHLSHDYDHDVVNAALPPGIALAYDGLRIPVVG
jgi:phosphoribosyl 1,2-cyclic phosphate phosphodiesterase